LPKPVGRVRAESEECPIRSVVTMIAISALISILTFVTAAAFWVDRAVLREAAFLESATEVLEMDSSQQALAERLMDEAVDAVPLLAFVRGAGERATVALLEEARSTRVWMARAGQMSVAEFEGFPLVDAAFFPAVLARGGRPWINDPFAFGALEETGQWDPSRLVSDLDSRTIPFALTMVNVGTEPAPPGGDASPA